MVHPVSDGPARHTIHSYYVCNPESPDGRHVLYYASTTASGHTGVLCVRDRAFLLGRPRHGGIVIGLGFGDVGARGGNIVGGLIERLQCLEVCLPSPREIEAIERSLVVALLVQGELSVVGVE